MREHVAAVREELDPGLADAPVDGALLLVDRARASSSAPGALSTWSIAQARLTAVGRVARMRAAAAT